MKKLLRKIFYWLFPELKSSVDYIVEQQKRINELEEKRCLLVVESSHHLTEVSEHVKNVLFITKELLKDWDISVDVHEKGNSWAVISLKGEKRSLIKFIDLGDKDIKEISNFLRHFERRNIDASPQVKRYLQCDNEF